MQKVFTLKPKNELFILEAFSAQNLKKVKDFNLKKQAFSKRNRNRKLTVNDLSILR
jgi:hypothetical protein